MKSTGNGVNDDKRSKKGPGKKAVILIVVLAVLCAGFAAWKAAGRPVDSSSKATHIFVVSQGEGASAVGDALEKAGYIRSGKIFTLQAKLSGNDSNLKAGQYAVSKSMSTSRIVDMMAGGETSGQVFTVTEGMSMYKIAAMLDDQGICTEKEFWAAASKDYDGYRFSKYIPSGNSIYKLEGFLYPDTYEVALDASAEDVINMMLKNFDRHVTKKYYTRAANGDMTILELITKASIVQREAGTVKDMPKVASVINNRLDRDMYLQMDSILSYILQEDKVINSYSDTQIDSDYNPYKNKGLPPGPICSPGMDAIDAAADPADTDYLFFVNSAKLDGTLAFSTNEEDFLKDKAAFEKAYKKSQNK
ncbi:MAG: endolytic transglycosylase MltG [Anaerovoracaceae bacterium]|jgi:UPF0755 protein